MHHPLPYLPTPLVQCPGHGVYLSEWGEGPSRALSVTPPYRNQNVQNFLTYIDSSQRADHEYVSPKSQLTWVKELKPLQAALGAPVSLCSKNSAGTGFFAQCSGRTLARWRRGPGFEPRPAQYFPRLFWPIPPAALGQLAQTDVGRVFFWPSASPNPVIYAKYSILYNLRQKVHPENLSGISACFPSS